MEATQQYLIRVLAVKTSNNMLLLLLMLLAVQHFTPIEQTATRIKSAKRTSNANGLSSHTHTSDAR